MDLTIRLGLHERLAASAYLNNAVPDGKSNSSGQRIREIWRGMDIAGARQQSRALEDECKAAGQTLTWGDILEKGEKESPGDYSMPQVALQWLQSLIQNHDWSKARVRSEKGEVSEIEVGIDPPFMVAVAELELAISRALAPKPGEQ